MIEWLELISPELIGAIDYGHHINEKEDHYLRHLFKWTNPDNNINLNLIRKDDGWYYCFNTRCSHGIKCDRIQEIITCFAALNPSCVDFIYDHNEDFIIGYLSMIKMVRPIHPNDYFYVKGQMGAFLKAGSYDRRKILKSGEHNMSDKFIEFVMENFV